MTALFAIALHTVRRAVRSRLAVTLLLLAALLVIVLPLLLRDDGTDEGRVRVMMVYTLNSAFALIVLAALWSACAAVSTDVESHRLHLVVTKPVPAAVLWFGQWLGLTGLHGLLLLLAWGGALGHLRARQAWTVPPAAESIEAAPVTARVIYPSLPATDAGPTRHLALPPGRTQLVRFRLPREPQPGQTASMDLRFAVSLPPMEDDSPMWPLQIDIGGASADSRVRLTGTFRAGMRHRIESVPLSGAEDRWLTLAIQNPRLDPAVTLILDLRGGLRLRIPESGPLRNHARAALILLARMGCFIAAGLTVGSLFSFPVAAFLGGFILFFATLAGYIRSVIAQGALVVPHEGPIPDPTIMDRLVMTAFRVFDLVLRPLSQPQPIRMLGSHEVITGTDTLIVVAVLWLGYVSVLAGIGMWALRRREIGAA